MYISSPGFSLDKSLILNGYDATAVFLPILPSDMFIVTIEPAATELYSGELKS